MSHLRLNPHCLTWDSMHQLSSELFAKWMNEGRKECLSQR
jgi:hypothetical protein